MPPPSHFPLLLLVLVFLSPSKPLLLRSPASFCSALSPDGLTLLAFKSAVSADPSSTLAGWDEDDDDPCRWPGVSCASVSGYAYPRVVALSVADKNLSGYIPSELGSLAFLRRLNLHGNFLSGPVPPQLSNATSLHSLFLYANNLSGPLPPSLCDLPRLQNLDLSRNALFGPVPAELRGCRQLQRLLLSGNRLSGEVPAGIWGAELGGLVQLDLSSNGLSGEIPLDLGDLRLLSGTLNLSHNQFSGGIPSNLGHLPPTVSLDLRGNNLSGEIPQVGSLSNQGSAAFLENPNLCGFPLPNPCKDGSSAAPGEPKNPSGNPVGGGKRGKKGLSLGMIVLIAVADAVGVAVIGLVLVYAYWKLKNGVDRGCSCTGKTKLGGGDGGGKPGRLCCWKRGSASSCSEEEEEEGENSSEGEGDHLVAMDKGFAFELEELLRASAYVLGKSGMGIVYKVVLGNGVPVAVRRLGEGGEQRRREFAAEAQAIGRVRHPNVVRLRAYYWSPDEKLLISDFVSNGSLAAALRRRSGQPVLTWPTRLRIARGTARGLAHIHECSKLVHGDVKPSNILLDADSNPRISDFGLLRLAHIASDGGAGTDASPAGLIGGGGGGGILFPSSAAAKAPSVDRNSSYRAPEARVPGGRPAQKWDVYSFGVVLLELLTGKPPAAPSSVASPAAAPTLSPSSAAAGELVRWVRKGFREERPLTELLDPALVREVQAKKEVVAAFHVALACTETDPELRPKMKAAADSLDKIGS